jgi:hypothetical protein
MLYASSSRVPKSRSIVADGEQNRTKQSEDADMDHLITPSTEPLGDSKDWRRTLLVMRVHFVVGESTRYCRGRLS